MSEFEIRKHQMEAYRRFNAITSKEYESICAERDSLIAERDRLRAALEDIAGFGRPLEAPKASYAVCEINDIAKEALSGGRGNNEHSR